MEVRKVKQIQKIVIISFYAIIILMFSFSLNLENYSLGEAFAYLLFFLFGLIIIFLADNYADKQQKMLEKQGKWFWKCKYCGNQYKNKDKLKKHEKFHTKSGNKVTC